MKFIQLYTSPTYEDFHALLIQPEENNHKSDEEKHRFSPIICRGVCDGGQIVWANTRISEGLTGRNDLPLNTAVGVPICSIGNELYILVLFAVGLIPMTPNAVEYLTTIARAVTEESTGFLSASLSSKIEVSPAKTEDFVGLWDINELIVRYTNEVEFHMLPMGKLQKFFDCHEILLFCDLFMDFKLSRDGRFTVKQLESLRETYRQSRERSDSLSSENSRSWEIGESNSTVDANTSATNENESLAATGGENSNHDTDNQPAGLFLTDGELTDTHVPDTNNNHVSTAMASSSSGAMSPSASKQPATATQPSVDNNSNEVASAPGHTGVYCIDLNSIECEVEPAVEELDEISPGLKRTNSSSSIVKLSSDHEINKSILHIYAHMTYKLSQCRFHEFMIAIMGMTVFEAAELWLMSEKTSELFLVAAVYRSPEMQQWIALSETLRLKVGTDGPGRIVEMGRSHWDSDFAKLLSKEPTTDPRWQAAREYGINTAFGVPLPGLKGICGAVMFYSSKKNFTAEPLLILLIEKAINLMAASSLDSSSWSRLDGAAAKIATREGQQPVATNLVLSRWLAEDSHGKTVNSEIYVKPSRNNSFSHNPYITRERSNSNLHQMAAEAAQQPQTLHRRTSSSTNLNALSRNNSVGNNLNGYGSFPLGKRYSGSNVSLTDLAAPNMNPIKATQMIVNKRLSDFDQRLEVCRSFLVNKDQQQTQHPMNAPPSQHPSQAQLSQSQHPSQLRLNVLPEGVIHQGAPNFDKDSGYINAYVPVSEHLGDDWNDPVVNAAYTLANFGRVQWKNFLEGSNNEISLDNNYKPLKLDSDKFMAMYAEGSRMGGGGGPSSSTGLHKCKVDDCENLVENPSVQYCITHRGTRRCQKEGCTKCAQGATKFCIAHGGGRRCTFPGCFKGARDKFFCAAHGGGKRCSHEGCSKSAVGGSNLCTAHGGGKRCQYPGCTKSSQSSTNYCVRHGGGRSCLFAGCTKVSNSNL